MSYAMRTQVPAGLERMVGQLPFPALVTNLCGDVLVWNAITSTLYLDYARIPQSERNLLHLLLINPVQDLPAQEVETLASWLIDKLRFDFSTHRGDPVIAAMIERLCADSAVFHKLWRNPKIATDRYILHRFVHGRFGAMTFEHYSDVVEGHPLLRLHVCSPADSIARRAVATVSMELRSITLTG